MNIIAAKSGLDGLLLRPLSARLLTPTIPEQTGVVDRSRLYAFVGRSRKGLIQLAHSFGFADDEIPSPSTGCSLTEKNFATRVFDLIQMDPDNRAWDFQLLQVGRHVRFNRTTKIVIGRREAENDRLEYLATRPDSRAAALLRPHNFSGPLVLVVGEADEHAVRFAGGLQLRFAGCEPREEPLAWLVVNGQQSLLVLTPYAPADAAATL